MITLGRHSYTGNIHERFEPIIEVGNFSSIASDTMFVGGGNHAPVFNDKAVSSYPFYEKDWGEYTHTGSKGKITIGNDVWICEDAMILGGVTIGDGAIIGARAMVSKDVPPYAVVVGNPGEIVKYRFDDKTIKKLLVIKWWEKTDEEIKELLPYMTDIEEFLMNI